MYCIAVLGLTFTTTILSVIKICPDDDKMFTPGYHCDNNYWSVPLCHGATVLVCLLSCYHIPSKDSQTPPVQILVTRNK